MLGLGIGAALGYFLSRIRDLEVQVRRLQLREPDSRRSDPRPSVAAPPPPVEKPTLPELDESPARVEAPIQRPAAEWLALPTEQEQETAQRMPSAPSPFDKLTTAAKNWLTTGNVPVKVGIIILFFGVAFLFKYAVDHRILVLPIELRLLAVSALAGVIFAFGWKLRDKSRVYALNLQGGSIGIVYLTIYAAFRLYAVLPSTVAFALLVLLTLASGWLAVKQDTRGLAAFASIGGFLAPLLTSIGDGSHVALFTYYLLINSAILGISWFRAWRSLNLIGFVFTFGVGTYLSFEYYQPDLYASVQPFLILNFLFYQAIAILYAFRQPPKLRGLVDGSIIFGTPAIVYSLQTQLVSDTEWGLAISAAVIALYYALVATWLRRRHPDQMQLLSQSMLVLGVGFATIAIPLALDDRWSAIAWALEGAGVVWLGVRQSGTLSRLTGSVLIIGSGYFYLEHGWRYDAGITLLNGNVLGGLIISCASIYAARLLASDPKKMTWQPTISLALLLWGTVWWLGTGAMEIEERTYGDLQTNLFVIFTVASFALLGFVGQYLDWAAARRVTYAYLPLLLPMTILYSWYHAHVLVGLGWIVWPIAIATHFLLMRWADDEDKRTLFIWHIAGVLLFTLILSQEAAWRARDMGLSQVWRVSAALLMPILTGAFLLFMRNRIRWPLQQHWSAYRSAAILLTLGQLVLLLGNALGDPGNPAPLTYIPIVNPYDLLTVLGLVIGVWLYRVWQSDLPDTPARQHQIAMVALGGLSFCLTTLMVVRGVHNFGDVAWNSFSLGRSVAVQSALSIYWAMLGFGGMILGTRQARYALWMIGVGLMVIVVLKLFFVDLGNTGTVARIISFLGVGGLLMVVGYFAPRPVAAEHD